MKKNKKRYPFSQPDKSNYFNNKYDDLKRFISYYFQKELIISLHPKKILEIGIGNSTLTNYLKNLGYNIKTCDIDKKLNPNYVGDVTKLTDFLKKDSFDLIACFEILEHIPFNYFEKALSETKKVTNKYVVISLPNAMIKFSFGFKIPLIKRKDFLFQFNSGLKHIFDNGHYWEIGKKKYSPKKIRRVIKKQFILKKEFVPPLNPNHRFYILEKQNSF